MYHHLRRAACAGAVCAAVAGTSSGLSQAASAHKTYTINMKVTKSCTKGSALCAKYDGKPFGKCTMSGRLKLPNTIQTWKCAGGTLVVTTSVNLNTVTGDQAKGTWKASKGTGAYRGITGSGSFSGSLATSLFAFKGKVTY